MAPKGQHVVPSGSKWSVRRSGAAKATAIYSTQEEAIERARNIARREKGEVYIHGRDGRIRDRRTYGKDPYPPPG